MKVYLPLLKSLLLVEGENENMTMNVAGALALVLCLTVTSNQQGDSQKSLGLSNTQVSFTTEAESIVTFDRNELRVVTLYNEESESIAKVAADEVIKGETKENRWGIQLTEEEIELLAKILWVEARGESDGGQQAVVEVIFNRIVSDEFPSTLYDVLSQKNPVQFASWKLRDTAEPTEREYASIYAVLNGNTSIVREDTLYFATKKLTRNLDIQIGGHYFCY